MGDVIKKMKICSATECIPSGFKWDVEAFAQHSGV